MDLEIGTRKQIEGVNLTFKKLKFGIEVKKNEVKTILDDVSGYVRPGQILAVLGPSGSGKTTLLNVLSDRVRSTTNKKTYTEGEIRFNGQRLGRKTKKLSGFVPQENHHFNNLTVKEILMISAQLRLPQDMTKEEKEKKVDQVISELGLQKVVDSVAGGTLLRGISGGEMKRLSVGVELITDPHILFMDEPTSGLDSHMAYALFERFEVLKQEGRSIVATIHQPSSKLVEKFDLILLLSEGKTVYFGPAVQAVQYFLEKCSLRCPLYSNPAEFYLDICSLNFEPDLEVGYEGEGKFEWTKAIEMFENDEKQPLEAEVDEINGVFSTSRSEIDIRLESEGEKSNMLARQPSSPSSASAYVTPTSHSPSFFHQMRILSFRSFTSLFRDKRFFRARFFQLTFISVLIGIIFFQLPYNQSGLRSRGGAVFFLCLQLGINQLFPVLNVFSRERVIIEHEREGKWYGMFTYFLSKSISEVPMQLSDPILYSCIAYFIIGLNPSASHFFTFLGVAVLVSFCCTSMGMLIASATPSFEIGSIYAGIFMIVGILFSGFFVDSSLIPVWLRWIKWVLYLFYAFQILIKNEFSGESFYCTSSEYNKEGVCPITTDVQAIRSFGVDENIDIGLYCVIILVIFIVLRMSTYLFLRFYRPKSE